MADEQTVHRITAEVSKALSGCPFVRGVVLGGSHATGTATDASDIDIGVYYDSGSADFDMLGGILSRLDDARRPNLLSKEGEWGAWVNCGAWLTMHGTSVDILLRDMARVEDVLARSDNGRFSAHYQTGHPHAYIDAMYRGELASSKILYCADEGFRESKKRAETYPQALKRALISFFSFEAGFSCSIAESNADRGDIYYLAGHAFRSVSALNQTLFALNEKWCLNEKKAVERIDGFSLKPERYGERVASVFARIGVSPADSLRILREMCGETNAFVEREAR